MPYSLELKTLVMALLSPRRSFFIPTHSKRPIAPYSVRLVVESTTTSGQLRARALSLDLGSALGTLMTSFYLILVRHG